LAEKILSACDGHDATLAQIEKRIEQFEESSTKMDPQEATKMTTELQEEIDVSWPK
jgi:septation ring formation regulator EzrA